MTATAPDAMTEWRRHFMLPIAAALGYACSVIHIYGLGPFIAPISAEFGWTRAEVTFGLTISTVISAVFCIPIGILVDRFGPRRLGLVGCLLMLGTFSLLGTATGELWNWYLLWVVLSLGTILVQATIWTAAVSSRFERARGLALAIALSGASIGATVFPPLATWLIETHGWQRAVAYEASIWAAVTFPVLLLFFRGARDRGASPDPTDAPVQAVQGGVTLPEAFRSSVFWRLFAASMMFTVTIIALQVHFVPVLTDGGAAPMAAAGIAALVGIFSIIGRLGTGFLLDRFRGSRVGALVFLLPAFGCLLLLYGGADTLALSVAAALIGLTLGSEIDVIAYLTSRYFGLRHFGALYGAMLVALSMGTAIGPVAAAAVFDSQGSYAPFLWLTIALMLGSSTALMTLPRPVFGADVHAVPGDLAHDGPPPLD